MWSGSFAIETLIYIEPAFDNISEAAIEAALKRYVVLRSVRQWENHILVNQTVTISKSETLIEG